MTVTDELLGNAEEYAAKFDRGELPLPPARRLAVLACMDARLNLWGTQTRFMRRRDIRG